MICTSEQNRIPAGGDDVTWLKQLNTMLVSRTLNQRSDLTSGRLARDAIPESQVRSMIHDTM